MFRVWFKILVSSEKRTLMNLARLGTSIFKSFENFLNWGPSLNKSDSFCITHSCGQIYKTLLENI